MELFDLEFRLAFGVKLFQTIEDLAARWAEAIRNGHETFPGTAADDVRRCYELWRTPRREILKLIERFESKGFEVEHAATVRKSLHRATLAVAAQPKELVTAVEQFSHGDTLTLAELRNAIHA